MLATYSDQVHLLISILPQVAKERCFALKGGTAINLFIRNMPRVSVDIDLSYLPVEDRDTSLKNINTALNNIETKKEGTPKWELFAFPKAASLPAVRWKLQNLGKMTSQKKKDTLRKLEDVLSRKYHV